MLTITIKDGGTKDFEDTFDGIRWTLSGDHRMHSHRAIVFCFVSMKLKRRVLIREECSEAILLCVSNGLEFSTPENLHDPQHMSKNDAKIE